MAKTYEIIEKKTEGKGRSALGEYLLSLRRNKGLTQSDLEYYIGKKGGYIAKIEMGKVIPPKDVCEQISHHLGGEVWAFALRQHVLALDPDALKLLQIAGSNEGRLLALSFELESEKRENRRVKFELSRLLGSLL